MSDDNIVDLRPAVELAPREKLLAMRQRNALAYLKEQISKSIDADMLGFRFAPSLMPVVKAWLDDNGFKWEVLEAGDAIGVELV